ncbi:UDP-N-acetylmuramoyl-tripeptide--D-alanyl-D-alanine ligase [Limnohabitans sp. Rim8]|uniref:UDP-N-acetylmuramoyl-tripeptide--D-alanyl-D- alanine ligase n=1 Tax=Limnohabitans sp. Rim8 TaxID=1100718 RepID=UPI003305F7B3
MSGGMQLSLQRILPWVNGAVVHGDATLQVERVHTDTRTLEPGDLFVALRGERFDGGQFIAQAKDMGAMAVLCDAKGLANAQAAGLAAVVVADTRLALGQLAAGWRAQFDLPLIAVTGSNGKTTVTQMLASILQSALPNASLATQGNLNNDIGVPLTLLRLRSHHEMAVVELGMSHPGEISNLAHMTRPTLALVNNAQREHQEFMLTVEAVARENGAVIDVLNSNGIAVFPIDDEYTPMWQSMAAGRMVVTFGLNSGDVHASEPVWTEGAWNFELISKSGQHQCRVHVAGRHNVKNALAAAACALSMGVSVQNVAQGLHAFEPVKGRSRSMTLRDGTHDITVIDDSYNANPDSVRAAIDVLRELPGPQLLVLGDMGEVGDQGPQFHAEVGAYAQTKGLTQVFTLGSMSHNTSKTFSGGRHFEDMAQLQANVILMLPYFNSILVKGSRFMRMERVLESLNAHWTPVKEYKHAS